MNILKKLSGKRTYILSFLAALYAAAIGTGLVESMDWVWALLGGTAVATLRAGVAQAEKRAGGQQ